MDKAKAAAKRRKYYPKIRRAYEKAVRKNPSASRILVLIQETSDAEQFAALLNETVAVGHQMRLVDKKKRWPTDIDVGSVYEEWQSQWGMEATYALQRAVNRRDSTALEHYEIFRSLSSRVGPFAGEVGLLNGEPNFLHFLGKAGPEQTAAFFQHVLDEPM